MKKIKEYLKVSILLIVCTFLAGSLLNSCEKVLEPLPLTITDITADIPCMLYVQSDTLILVNSNIELQTLCSYAPTFDFSDASLIICSGIAPGGLGDLKGVLYKTSEQNYTLKIKTLEDESTAAFTQWTALFSTSRKINSDISIILEVESYGADEYDEFYNN